MVLSETIVKLENIKSVILNSDEKLLSECLDRVASSHVDEKIQSASFKHIDFSLENTGKIVSNNVRGI